MVYIFQKVLTLPGILIGLAQLLDDEFVAIDFVIKFFVLLETGCIVDVLLALLLQVRCFVIFVFVLVLVEFAGVAVVSWDEGVAVGLLRLVVHGLPQEVV